jgi:hypothetical protein
MESNDDSFPSISGTLMLCHIRHKSTVMFSSYFFLTYAILFDGYSCVLVRIQQRKRCH